jgi:endonuclease/exonuclease/phosphatase family metal-dependent hydrolase
VVLSDKFQGIWIVAFLCLFQAVASGAETFRVATYNLENYIDTPSGNRPMKSAEARARVRDNILAMKPDVIALEEVGSSNALLALQAALKTNGLDLPNWDEVNGYDTNIHICVLSRFPIIARRPHTNETFLLQGRRMSVTRGFAELDIQVNKNYRFTLIAAHLKSRLPSPVGDQEEWRYEEAVALRHVLDGRFEDNPGQNLIVLGDFNDIKDSKPIRTIMGRGRGRLFDTRPGERNGDSESRTITWTHYYSKEDSYSRIDYILLSHGMEREWLPEETYVLSVPNWGVASDHRALVAGFVAEDR